MRVRREEVLQRSTRKRRQMGRVRSNAREFNKPRLMGKGQAGKSLKGAPFALQRKWRRGQRGVLPSHRAAELKPSLFSFQSQ